MKPVGRRIAGLLLAPALAWGQAGVPPLRVVAPVNQSMPMLRMSHDQPVDGLLKDLGEILAQRVGRRPVFVALPSKRAQMALMSGDAELHCYVMPGWLHGDLLWTHPFMDGVEVVAAAPGAPALERLQDLRGEPVGTVLGYLYPRLDEALGQPLRREDTVDADTNLRRLALGRLRYALTDRIALRYWVREHPDSGLHEAAEFDHHRLGCALAPREAKLLPELNHVIDEIVADGTLVRLLARYR